jgi:hypothetical protein
MEISPDASAGSPHHFLTHRVEPGALVITDGWIGHLGITGLCYGHVRGNQRAARARGEDPGELLPRVNRVAGLARRWCQSPRRASGTDERPGPGEPLTWHSPVWAMPHDGVTGASRMTWYYRMSDSPIAGGMR